MNCQKHLFNLDPEVTYLNCAYMSPLMKEVEQAGIKGLLQKRQPDKVTGDDFFADTELLRTEFGKLINVKQTDRLVIIPSVSYGMANVAKNLNLQKGDNIILVGEQFPSNVYPWMEIASQKGANIKTIPPPGEIKDRGRLWNTRLLEAIDSKTRLVAIGHIHWADGTLFDLKAIRKRNLEVGAWLVIDGTQSIGALPFDVEELQPDALIAAGYKSMMGPYSIGMAYYGEALDEGIPVEQNWINRYKSEDFANLVNYSEKYQPGALRYEVGERSNFILVPMMLKALRKLNEWGAENVQQYCRNLIREPLDQLRNHRFIVEDERYRASNLFGIRLGDQHSMDQVKKNLQEAKVFVSYRGDAIRVSPNVYNDSKDLDTLLSALTT